MMTQDVVEGKNTLQVPGLLCTMTVFLSIICGVVLRSMAVHYLSLSRTCVVKVPGMRELTSEHRTLWCVERSRYVIRAYRAQTNTKHTLLHQRENHFLAMRCGQRTHMLASFLVSTPPVLFWKKKITRCKRKLWNGNWE